MSRYNFSPFSSRHSLLDETTTGYWWWTFWYRLGDIIVTGAYWAAAAKASAL